MKSNKEVPKNDIIDIKALRLEHVITVHSTMDADMLQYTEENESIVSMVP